MIGALTSAGLPKEHARCTTCHKPHQWYTSYEQTCKRCHTYLKTVITEETLPHDLLSLEDLATLYLDQGCQQKGYTRHIQ